MPVIHFFSKFVARHFDFSDVFALSAEDVEKDTRVRRPSFRKRLLLLLKLVPWVCVGGFIFSLFWDFGPQDVLLLFGEQLVLKDLLKTLCVSGLIGYGTNFIAIRMLFKPRERRPIFGQGLIPANKDAIAEKLAVTINRNILDEEEIKRRIREAGVVQKLNQRLREGTSAMMHDEEFQQELRRMAYEWLREYFDVPARRQRIVDELDERIQEEMRGSMGGRVLRSYLSLSRKQYRQRLDRLVANLPERVYDVLEENSADFTAQIDSQLTQNADHLEEALAQTILDLVDKIRIYQLLRSQLKRFDEGKLEEMIWHATNEHLLYIQYLGGFLGILGGFILWQPRFMLISFGVLAAGLFLLENVLRGFRKTPSGS